MLTRRIGWKKDYRWGRGAPWVNGPWNAFGDLAWYFDARFGSLDSVVRGKTSTKGSFSRAGTPYYWDEGLIKAVAANTPRFEEDYGAVKALLLEPVATNKCIQSRNFGGWTASATPTEAQDQTGIDGTANAAWTIGDNDASGLEGEVLALSVANDSNTHCFSVFIKKDTTTTRMVGLRVRFQAGAPIDIGIHVNTSTGAIANEAGGTAPTASGIEDHGLWWRAWLAASNNGGGNTTAIIGLRPAVGTVLGTVANAAVGTCVVDAAQFEFNTKYPTSFVLTAGAEASRTTEASGATWTLPTGIFTGTKVFTAVAVVKLNGAEADFAANHNILATSAVANSLMYVDNSGDFAITDATSTVTKDVNVARLTRYRVAVKADGTPEINSGAVAASSAWTSAAWGTAAAYDGAMAVGASLLLGQTLGFPMWVEKVWIFNRVLNDAEINLLR
jgi:hypothetical protein